MGLPQTHHYLIVRLHIEQQRFLNFALEAGVLNEEGVVCSTLQVNRSLLLTVLAEIKGLFVSYARVNGRYENIVSTGHLDLKDHSEPDHDLMSLLCVTAFDDAQLQRVTPGSKRSEATTQLRRLGKCIAQTGKNLRTIVVEPKRLVWAAVDKSSFEDFISKIEYLNSFLIGLLDSSQLRRLQESMTTAYLEILQLRNDVSDLTTLIKALSPAAENQENHSQGADLTNNDLSQTLAKQQVAQDNEKRYLVSLAEIKMQLTEINQMNNINPNGDFRDLIEAPLPLINFQFAESVSEFNNLHKRTRANYRGRKVWIEWKDTQTSSPSYTDDTQIQWRIGLLTNLLCSVKPGGFRAAPCVGYIKTTGAENAARFGVVFQGPSNTHANITSLWDLLAKNPKPSLSARVKLCAVLAGCVHSLHAVDWLHKALRAENVVFFPSSESSDLDEPFISGFELSRPSIMDQWSEEVGLDAAKDIYRHPNAQSSRTDGKYRKSYDIYSLGVIMTEIALWKRIEDIVGIGDLGTTKPSKLQEVQLQLLKGPPSKEILLDTESCLEQISSACGDSICEIIKSCLEVGTTLEPQNASGLDLVKKLESISKVV